MLDTPVPVIPRRPEPGLRKSGAPADSDQAPIAQETEQPSADTASLASTPVIPPRPQKKSESGKGNGNGSEESQEAADFEQPKPSPAPVVPSRPKSLGSSETTPPVPSRPKSHGEEIPQIPSRPKKSKEVQSRANLVEEPHNAEDAEEVVDTEAEVVEEPVSIKKEEHDADEMLELAQEKAIDEDATPRKDEKEDSNASQQSEKFDVVPSHPEESGEEEPNTQNDPADAANQEPQEEVTTRSTDGGAEESKEVTSSDIITKEPSPDDLAEVVGNKIKELRENSGVDIKNAAASPTETVEVETTSPADEVEEIDVGTLKNEHGEGAPRDSKIAEENLTTRSEPSEIESKSEPEVHKSKPVDSEATSKKHDQEEVVQLPSKEKTPDVEFAEDLTDKQSTSEITGAEENTTSKEQAEEVALKKQEDKIHHKDKSPIMPVIPLRPGKPKTVESGSDTQTETGATPSIPARPPRPSSKDKPKAPPPKPKKLSSKIAAFQQMFNQPATEAPQPQERSVPEPRGKLSSDKTSFAANLQNMMGPGIALPGMANPELLKKLAPASPEKEESQSKPDPGLKGAPRRAKGPRGKRLPKSVTDAKIEESSDLKTAFYEVWEIDFNKSTGAGDSVSDPIEAKDIDDSKPSAADVVVKEDGASDDIDEVRKKDVISFAIPVADKSAEGGEEDDDEVESQPIAKNPEVPDTQPDSSKPEASHTLPSAKESNEDLGIETRPRLEEKQQPVDPEEELKKIEQINKAYEKPTEPSLDRDKPSDLQSDVEPDYEIVGKATHTETPKVAGNSDTDELDDSGFEEAREAFSSPKRLDDVLQALATVDTEEDPTAEVEEQLRELSEILPSKKVRADDDQDPVLVDKETAI